MTAATATATAKAALRVRRVTAAATTAPGHGRADDAADGAEEAVPATKSFTPLAGRYACAGCTNTVCGGGCGGK